MWDKVFGILKRRIKVVIILFLAFALFLGYFIGRVNNSRDRVITTLEVALKNGDVKSLSKIVILNNKKVSKEKLQPLLDYYDENSKAIDNDIKMLRNGSDTSVFTINREKKLFKAAYNVELKVYNIKVDSNYTEGKFTIDNKNYINSGENMEKVIPGVYTINGILKSEYGDVEASKEFVLMKDENIQVDFNAVNITIQSQFKDADVYVNNEYTGMTVDEAKDIGPFKDDGSVSVFIEKKFPWGTIKGNEVCVTDKPVLNLSINMTNEKMKKEIQSIAEEFYKSVFIALNKEEKSYIKEADDSVRDKIYSVLVRKYTFLKNKYSVKDIEIMDEKSEYTYEDEKYKANVVVKVSYDTEKNLFGFDKEENSKMFFTKLIYNEDEEKWIVNDVENFSL